jgi:hypothetical protein
MAIILVETLLKCKTFTFPKCAGLTFTWLLQYCPFLLSPRRLLQTCRAKAVSKLPH